MQKLFTAKSNSQVPPPQQIVPQHFVACMYDDDWWIGMVKGIEGDIFNINFMHQKGLIPNSGFQWPRRPDICPVNSKDVLLNTDTPALSSNTARSYSISRDIFTTVQLKEFSIIVTMLLFNFMCSKLIYTYKLSIVTENRSDPPRFFEHIDMFLMFFFCEY